jgi:hypothetical protein
MSTRQDNGHEYKCIYCLQTGQPSQHKEHVLPQCLGAAQELECGLVCDKCNQYLSKLARTLCDHPDIAKAIIISRPRGKHGRKAYYDQLLIEETSPGNLTLTFAINLPTLPPGSGAHVTAKLKAIPSADFRAEEFSRALHYVAFNALCFKHGPELVYEKQFDSTREFVRNPKSNREYRAVGLFESKGKIELTTTYRHYAHAKTISPNSWLS